MRFRGTAELTLVEYRAGLVTVAQRRGQEARLAEKLPALIGVGWPPARRATSDAECAALRIGPTTALIRGPSARLAALRSGISRDMAAVVDQSGGFAILRLAGPKAISVLAKGCRIDLDSSAFGPGDCARTLIAQTPIILHGIDAAPSYDLIVPRTLARSFAEFLMRSAQFCGVELSAFQDREDNREVS
jgi:heterotetrameric sarcosine oxidase gamma subunit